MTDKNQHYDKKKKMKENLYKLQQKIRVQRSKSKRSKSF